MFLILQKNPSNKKRLCWQFPLPLGPGVMVTLSRGEGCSPKQGQHEWRGHMNYVLTLTDSNFYWPLTNYILSFIRLSIFFIIWNMSLLLAGWPALWPFCWNAFMCGFVNQFLITQCMCISSKAFFHLFCHFFLNITHFTVSWTE